MDTRVNIPGEVKRPDENWEVMHTLPDSWIQLLEIFSDDESLKREKSHQRRLKQRQRRQAKNNVIIKETWATTVHLSWEVKIETVKNRIKEHMKAYPETSKGFYARFIDYDGEDEWYIVLPCNIDDKNCISINWLYYKIYPFWNDSKKLVKLIAKELSEALKGDMDDENVAKTINEQIIDVLKFSPLDEEWVRKFKDDIIDILLKDPKLLNGFWKKKYIVLDYINKAFNNI